MLNRFRPQSLVCSLAIPVVALLSLGVGYVRAQTQRDRPERNLVVTDEAAYLPGARQMLSPAQANVVPDPRGRYVLIQCTDTDPRTPLLGEMHPGGCRLLLYDAVTGDVHTVWHQNEGDRSEWLGDIVQVEWLPQTDTAVAVVSDRDMPRPNATPSTDKPDFSLLFIRAPLGSASTRRLREGEDLLYVEVSPKLPLALVEEDTQVKDPNAPRGALTPFTRQYFPLTAKGTFGSPLPLSPKAFDARAWNAEGDTAYFYERIPSPAVVPDATGIVPPPARPRFQWSGYNLETQKAVTLDKRPTAPRAEPEKPVPGPLRLVSGTLNLPRPGSEAIAQSVLPATRTPQAAPIAPAAPASPASPVSPLLAAKPKDPGDTIAPLWLVRADGKTEGYLPSVILIAPDAQRCILLADNSAVLYIADAAVYAVPLTRSPRPGFDALYQQYMQKVTMSNLKQIGLGLMMYSQDYDEQFPPSGDVAKTIGPYVMDSNLFNNPITGQPGFTYLLNGDQQASMKSPATTVIGYLSGPGGHAVLYGDGHVRWEDVGK